VSVLIVSYFKNGVMPFQLTGIYHFGNIIPTRLFLYSGERVHLRCYSVARPVWLYFDGPVGSEYLTNGGFSITITNTTYKHTGRYFCRGLLPSNEGFLAMSSVYIGGKWNIT